MGQGGVIVVGSDGTLYFPNGKSQDSDGKTLRGPDGSALIPNEVGGGDPVRGADGILYFPDGKTVDDDGVLYDWNMNILEPCTDGTEFPDDPTGLNDNDGPCPGKRPGDDDPNKNDDKSAPKDPNTGPEPGDPDPGPDPGDPDDDDDP